MRFNVYEWLLRSYAGFIAAGAPGMGKSQLFRLIALSMAWQGKPAFIFDPAGSLRADIQKDFAAQPKRVRNKLRVYRAASFDPAPNPLHVDGVPGTPEFTSRLVTRVKHTARILLAAWGQENFHGTPLLAKWMTILLLTLAITGLPLACAIEFFKIGSPLYQALTRHAPDIITQLEMQQLQELDSHKAEELIASTKNRTVENFRSPGLSIPFSHRGQPVDIHAHQKAGHIVVISLETAGILDPEHVEIIANAWLQEIIHVIFNTPIDNCIFTAVLLDELPLWQTSFPLIRTHLPLCRKYLCRFGFAWQSAFNFKGGLDNELFNLVFSTCSTGFFFRHTNPHDLHFLARVTTAGTFSAKSVKDSVTRIQQLTKGHTIQELADHSNNWSKTEQKGSSEAEASGNTSTHSQGDSDVHSWAKNISDSLNAVGTRVGSSEGMGKTHGAKSMTSKSDAHTSTTTKTKSASNSFTDGGSKTIKQTLVPIIETISTEEKTYHTPEELDRAKASEIVNYHPGECTLWRPGKPSLSIRLPLVTNHLDRTPLYCSKQVAALRSEMKALSGFPSYRQLKQDLDQYTFNLCTQINTPVQRHSEGDADERDKLLSSQPLIGDSGPTDPAVVI